MLDKHSELYFSYSIRKEGSSEEDEGAMATEEPEQKSFLIHGARHTHVDSYIVSLVYTNFVAEGAHPSDPYLGAAHVSLPLSSALASWQLASVLPTRLQSSLYLPLTLLLTRRATVLVLIGGQVASESPLLWTDDLAELEDDAEVGAVEASTASLLTLDGGGKGFAVSTKVGLNCTVQCQLWLAELNSEYCWCVCAYI